MGFMDRFSKPKKGPSPGDTLKVGDTEFSVRGSKGPYGVLRCDRCGMTVPLNEPAENFDIMSCGCGGTMKPEP